MSDIQKAASVVKYFVKLQKEFGYKESGNILQFKWDMRDVIEHIDDDKDLQKLILFFLKNSNDKSMKYFFKNYNDYYNTMLNIITQRKLDAALLKKTVKNKK